MGNKEEGKPSKPEKTASPAPADQSNVHVFPEWAAMQAYYGPRVAIPQFYNPAVASGHAAHPYIWGPPQPMMAPYGAPYAAFCSPGGLYPYPGVPIGTPSQGHGAPSTASTISNDMKAMTSLSMDTTSAKSSGMSQGFMKKLKEFDGLAISIGNGNAYSAERRVSQSSDTEGSSSGSGNMSQGEQAKRKRSREEGLTIDMVGKPQTHAGEACYGSKNTPTPTVTPGDASQKPIHPAISPLMTTTLELRNCTPNPCTLLPPEPWKQNERELKREKRKQSNRESARRSRLRKQAETEELAVRVESLTSENMTLRTEINQLKEKSEKLKTENAALMEKLKKDQPGEFGPGNNGSISPPVNTENFLCRVKNSGSSDTNAEREDNEAYEKGNPGAKLHQLLDRKPRSNAVAAG